MQPETCEASGGGGVCGLVLRYGVEGRWSALSCSRSSVRSDLVRLLNLRTEPVFLPIENISLSDGRTVQGAESGLALGFCHSMRSILARLTLRVIKQGVAGRARLCDVGSGGVEPAVFLRLGARLD